MNNPAPAPGWYPDPSDPAKQLYWDGRAWMGPSGPMDRSQKSRGGSRKAANIGVVILVVIGFLMSMQSVNLFTGSGPIWTGVAVVAVGAVLAFVLKASGVLRVLAILALLLVVGNALYIEDQMSTKRNEISEIFDR